MTKKVREHIGFYYLLLKILLLTLIPLKYIPQDVLNKIRDKYIMHKIFSIQDDDSIMFGLYCSAFIEYMIAEKTLLDYTKLFSPNDDEKSDKIIYNYFKNKYGKPWLYTKKKNR